MKNLFKWTTGLQLAAVLFLAIFSSKAQAQPGVTVSFQTFYDDLSPYGQWVDDPQYGNVFVPTEEGDFRPYYTRGHWVMTDYGNTWVSDDSWGWACYHYGRWTYDSYYGWVWVPGYDWAPAWVDWRYGGDQCGWAPLGPGISIGVGVYNCPDNWWVFVGPQYLYRNDFYHYWRGPQYNNVYIHNTTIINNIYRDNGTQVRYNYGPRAEQIQRYTHQTVPVYKVNGAGRPGAANISGHALNLYRPAVNRETRNTARPANVIRAPHAVGAAHAVQEGNKPSAFRTAVQHGQVRPMNGNAEARPNPAMQHNGAPAQAPHNNIAPHNQPNSGHPMPTQQHGQRQPIQNTRPQIINHSQPQPQHANQPAHVQPQRMNHQQSQPAQQHFSQPAHMQQQHTQAPQQHFSQPAHMQQQHMQAPPQHFSQPAHMQAPPQRMAPQQHMAPQPHMNPGGGGHPGGGEHPEGGRR